MTQHIFKLNSYEIHGLRTSSLVMKQVININNKVINVNIF